ncbi:MAG TPA: hypothetical protein VK430_11895 [Xanthobacteraceae bacterium]|nr:hypothetical protein [Xanthobacteraceae bacterium]
MARVEEQEYPSLQTLAAVIARSQIVVAEPAKPGPCFPAGFDDVDLAILDWIAAEARRLRRRLVLM